MGMSYADALLLYFLLWIVLIAILWWRELSRVKSFEWHLSNSRLFHCFRREPPSTLNAPPVTTGRKSLRPLV